MHGVGMAHAWHAHGMAWHGMAWHGTRMAHAWHGMARAWHIPPLPSRQPQLHAWPPAGLLPATSGAAHINGLPVKTRIAEIRQALGVCPQLNTIFPALTPTQHFVLYASIKGVQGAGEGGALHAMVAAMLESVQLVPRAHTPARALSGGQKRKVSFGQRHVPAACVPRAGCA